ncbi:hypothetical protein GCM10010923_07960 [Blastomonas marina]|uniref:JmjC domain-containing protein n=1 Tax=Blastomonas marina TaxID=1867408 RepID=A0ABQ1F6M2_9SPHN|nr:transcriptional regulator [Blastomonas marina]GGA01588.1 hypothetical protein GCM10010923_07960 [Blastomonas marina]
MTQAIFPDEAQRSFAECYPETPHKLVHALDRHALLEREALARLGETLPAASVEYNRGDVPIGVDDKPPANGLSIGETIRRIDEVRSWAVLKNIEQVPAYRDLVAGLLEELRAPIEAATGAMLKPQGYIFVSSPDAVTPYHFDPEHNILLQLEGSKAMTQFPAGHPRFAPDTAHEAYHTGGGRELTWQDGFIDEGHTFALDAGEALYVPVMAPHFVRNGGAPSISLSITWRSEWSFAEADARAFNRMLRGIGLTPRAPGRWPARNRAKAMAWRALRRMKSA